MKRSAKLGLLFAGLCAGAINGLLGAGGGMALVPLLSRTEGLTDQEIFPVSVSVILPICLVSLVFSDGWSTIQFTQVLPYLVGSTLGGFGAGFFGRKIPTHWLHRFLGIIILWGGLRFLC